ncbi:UDP-glucose/GDP-mannose dehydrogenase family protein [Methanoculleus sp. YWC-01]|uniref:UDP-glucose 6-dehydrogenase n=1 Tax=Methanoculleus nereidis TaxID=2735141 RepID=A0ABU3Z2Q7_9EURY|nr:UDP-glucose/GDP-mannose dehydrogenase family protein [Methanoculleus sp. YWC-01]MDV4343103.1 UDP-glucose/GDP-mannose dehydrogenase family protein [Methanoculleus sp. YWC-01]
MSYSLSIIGCGYVGCVTGVCFADMGNEVTLVDVDSDKVDFINEGRSPIYEPGLEALMQKNRERVRATTNLRAAIHDTDITFVAVGTPSNADGSIDLTYVFRVCEEIGEVLREKEDFHIVIIKSTVFPGTTDDRVRHILEYTSGKKAGVDFGLGSNPEFLREGNAVHDFLSPDRIVIGADDPRTADALKALYASIDSRVLVASSRTAEMIKYTSNAILATKISFANEIGNLCKTIGIDSGDVFLGVGMDSRVSPAFFRTGIGFGGSCFPKDVRALVAGARAHGEDLSILDAVLKTNETQPLRLLALLKKHIPDLDGKTIGVLGLAFKPDTDDIRESRALPVITGLLSSGAGVIAYDPAAMDNFRRVFPQITYASSAGAVLEADAVLILTEWKEFEDLDYHGRIVIDGRRLEAPRRQAAIYEGVCW